MKIDRTRRWVTPAVAVLTIGSLLAAGGCGEDETPAVATASGFTADAAAAVLSAFDKADSAASTTGDEVGLRQQEAEPALLFSLGAIRSAQANNRKQAAFQHVSPAFAIPADASCFVAVAMLRLTGEELERRDVSVFVQDDNGTWRLSHNVLLGQETSASAVAIDPVGMTGGYLPADRQERLAREVFQRTMGETRPDDTIDPAPLLDQRLAGGWTIYQQQLSAAGLAVTRKLDSFAVSPCAARVAGQTLLFLTLKFTDTMAAAPGKTATATLAAQSPDGIALGLTEDASGKSVSVERTEVFLLSIVTEEPGRGSVLGLNDVATNFTVVD